MNRNPNLGLYAVAVAIVVVGALWVGVPVGTLAFAGVALACPLMMIFMMGGMHGGSHSDDGQRRVNRGSDSKADDRRHHQHG